MWTTWITVFGFCFIFLMTTLGSAVVYFFKGEISPKVNAFFLGLASGVMIAASVWSLLLPAIEQAERVWGKYAFLPIGICVLLGGVLLVLLDKCAPTFYKKGEAGDLRSDIRKPIRLFLAVTLHNIPEGLAVGFAFGAAASLGTTAAYLSALGLAIGIGIQNFPEGAAISLPMKNALKNNHKAFLWGTCSGIAEPIFAVIGYFLASKLLLLQPWLLSFSAGAMLFVSAQDLIPDSKLENTPRIGAWGVLIGFIVMMALDVALG